MLERIQQADEDAQILKILSKYNDDWSTLEQEVEEFTQKYQTDMKINNN